MKRSGAEPLRFHPLLGVTTFFLGVIAMFVIQQVFAQNLGSQIVYACVQKQTGNVRIVSINTQCHPDEYSFNWGLQGPQGPQGPAGQSGNNGLPYSCSYNCNLGPYADKFKGQDFTGAQLVSCYFFNADISGVIFKNANLDGCAFVNSNLTGADLSSLSTIDNYPPWGTGQGLSNVTFFKLTGSNFTGVNFSNDMINADFTGVNLTHANFTNTNLNRTQGLGSATTTDAIWSNTTCPDGTNSDSNGHTCVGHF